MVLGASDRKKQIEARYVEEARVASSCFPAGPLVPRDPLDFLLDQPLRRIGIEVTELCREQPRAEAGRLSRIPDKARTLYSRRPDAQPVDVSAAFSHWSELLRTGELVQSLSDFVNAHRHAYGAFTRALPEGYCHIGVFPALAPGGRWRYFRAFNTVLATRDLIAARIAEKNRRLASYRRAAPEVCLLLVNEMFLGAGEVCTRDEDLAAWRFDSGFDKVLLLQRQPGGSGKVFELRCA